MDQVQPNIIEAEPKETLLDKILKISLIVLTIVVIGFGGYVFMSANQNKISLKTVFNISPTATVKKDIIITPTTIVTDNPSDINVGSVEADLKDIGVDVKNLQ